jgi:hypothetical protein
MADLEANVPTMPTDAELFQSATAEPAAPPTQETPAPVAAEPTAQPTPTGQPRDPLGRWTKGGDGQEAAAPAHSPQTDDIPPSHRWKELREERDAAQNRLREMEFAYYDMQQRQRAMEERFRAQQPQQKPQVPDPITDAEAFNNYYTNQLNERLRTQEQNFSFRIAHDRHGEAFERAYGEMIARAERGDPSVVRAVMQSPDPGAAMMNWYHQATNLARIGNTDPDTWAEKVWLDEKLKDPKFKGALLERMRAEANQGQASGSPSPVNLPPSLSRIPASAPVGAVNGDLSDASLFDYAFRQGRPPR